MSKPEFVWVMPVKGKYCEIVYDNRAYKIWKVNPGSPDRFGTQLPYDAAVYFLGKVPPVISLVPEIKGSKYISPLEEEDTEKINESRSRGFVGSFRNYNQSAQGQVSGIAGANPGADSALKKALDLLAEQSSANKALQESLKQLQDKVEKLEKPSVLPPGSGGGQKPPDSGQNA
jgi:hypothetical protein